MSETSEYIKARPAEYPAATLDDAFRLIDEWFTPWGIAGREPQGENFPYRMQ